MSTKITNPYDILKIPKDIKDETFVVNKLKIINRKLNPIKNPENKSKMDYFKHIASDIIADIRRRNAFEKRIIEIKNNPPSDMMFDINDSIYKPRELSSYLKERDDIGTINSRFEIKTEGLPQYFNETFEYAHKKRMENERDIDIKPTGLDDQLAYSEYDLDSHGERRIVDSKYVTSIGHSMIDDDNIDMLNEVKFDEVAKYMQNENTPLTQNEISERLKERNDINYNVPSFDNSYMSNAHDNTLEKKLQDLETNSLEKANVSMYDTFTLPQDTRHEPLPSTQPISFKDITQKKKYQEMLQRQQHEDLPIHEKALVDDYAKLIRESDINTNISVESLITQDDLLRRKTLRLLTQKRKINVTKHNMLVRIKKQLDTIKKQLTLIEKI